MSAPKHQPTSKLSNTAGGSDVVRSRCQEIPSHVVALLQRGSYVHAYEIMRKLRGSPLIRHSCGVCALRSGLTKESLHIFRELALVPGSTIVRIDVDDTLRINYAVALLKTGLPSGALEVLREARDQNALGVLQVRQSIKQWAAGLPFWRRLDWNINRVDPPSCDVPFPFELGCFPFPHPVFDQPTNRPTTPTNTGDSANQAA